MNKNKINKIKDEKENVASDSNVKQRFTRKYLESLYVWKKKRKKQNKDKEREKEKEREEEEMDERGWKARIGKSRRNT